MACEQQAYNAYLAEQQASDEAFAEFGVATTTAQDEYNFNTLTIWREFLPILPLFDYVVFKFNHMSGHVLGVDWVAVDVLLRRENVSVTPDDFANWRVAMSGYVEALNEHIASKSDS